MIKQFGIKQTLKKKTFSLLGLFEKDNSLFLMGSTVVEDNDLIYLIIDEKTLDDIFTIEGRLKTIEKIIIVGSNKIGKRNHILHVKEKDK